MRNWVALKRVDASAGKSRVVREGISECSASAASVFHRRGLLRALRPALPKVNPRGATKAPGLSSSGPKLRLLLPPTGFAACGEIPDQSGYEPESVPLATPALSSVETPLGLPPFTTVNGMPDSKSVIPDTSHPPRTERIARWA